MKVSIRPFDPVQHSLYDRPGKQAIRAFFEAKGCKVEVDPFGPHGVDLKVTDPKLGHFYCDPEVRAHAWTEGPWPYPTVHIVERKFKYTKLDGLVLFASLRADLGEAVFTWGHELTPERLEPNPINKWEYVYSVPLSCVRQVRLNNHQEGKRA